MKKTPVAPPLPLSGSHHSLHPGFVAYVNSTAPFSLEGKKMGFGVKRLVMESSCATYKSVWLWVSHLISLNMNLIFCKKWEQ